MYIYKPAHHAVFGFIASVFASLSLPVFGFVLSQYIFVLAMYGNPMYPDLNQTIFLRNMWTISFVALCIGIGATSYI